MRIASSHSLAARTEQAAAEAIDALLSRLGRSPGLLVVYATEHHARPELIAALRAAAPDAQIAGGTSCGGVMTEAGFHSGPDGALGLLGICDPQGSYGVGTEPLGENAVAASARAMSQALEAAGRDFELPVLVWCCQPPGQEEAIIDGIQSVIGRNIPIIGGSTGDEANSGAWRQFATQGVLQDHVVVAALFPTTAHGTAFQSGYAPTQYSGVVTRAADRRLIEIDGLPASEVYSRWTQGAIDSAPGTILAKSAPTPLGRVAAEQNNLPMFVLSHPVLIGADGDLSLFTDIAVGDTVHLMRGSPELLVKRAGLVVNDARVSGGWSPDGATGGLVIYCAGCMLHVRGRMPEVAQRVAEAMGGAPFLGAFTFGEQGAIIDNCNRHGNLMVASLTFGR